MTLADENLTTVSKTYHLGTWTTVQSNKTALKIASFSKLKEGWNFSSGVPFSRQVLDIAIEIDRCFQCYGLETDAFPGLDGEVMVAAYSLPIAYEVVVNPNGSW